MYEERRQPVDNSQPSPDLVQRGKFQLDAEIRILETWLLQLDETRKDNTESLAARKALLCQIGVDAAGVLLQVFAGLARRLVKAKILALVKGQHHTA